MRGFEAVLISHERYLVNVRISQTLKNIYFRSYYDLKDQCDTAESIVIFKPGSDFQHHRIPMMIITRPI
jgi:hypothetical protein